MDMLYARYSCPMDLISRYINQRRFGDFVTHIIKSDQEHRKEKAEKENDFYLWIAYVHQLRDIPPEMTFTKWKAAIKKLAPDDRKRGGDADLDDAGIQNIIDHLFPGG